MLAPQDDGERVSVCPGRSTRFLEIISSVFVFLLLPALAAGEPAAFVDAASVVEGLALDLRYFGEHNFVGRRIDGYEAARCFLSREAASALAAVQRDLAAQGLGLQVFDCYRPVRAVAHFVRWARDLRDVKTKAEFYPRVDKSELFREGYIASRSGHSRGSTVDITLVRRENGRELDMGSPFDFFGPISSPSSAVPSRQARDNRALLANAMRRRGFRPYDREWWHFTLRNEPFPNTYFDFVVK